MYEIEHKNIIFFDDDCLLCNRIVKIVFKFDKKGNFFYSANKSDIAGKLKILEKGGADYLILYSKGEFFFAEEAVIEILHILGFGLFIKIFPKKTIAMLYKIIAQNRYKFSGKKKCKIPGYLMKKVLD